MTKQEQSEKIYEFIMLILHWVLYGILIGCIIFNGLQSSIEIAWFICVSILVIARTLTAIITLLIKEYEKMNIDELLVDFDEMGFAPTTLCENPDEYACKWKRQLSAEIDRLKTQLAQANAGIVNCSGCKLVEINAVREFAERLKDKVKNFCGTEEENHYYDVSKEGACEEIDELLKEYGNEKRNN